MSNRLGIILVLSMTCPGPQSVAAGEPGLVRLKSEYPAASARLREAYSQIRVVGRRSGGVAAEGKRPQLAVATEALTRESSVVSISGPFKKAVLETFTLDSQGAKRRLSVRDYVIGKNLTFNLYCDFKMNHQRTISSVNRLGDGQDALANDKTRRIFDNLIGKYLYAPFQSDVFDVKDLLNGDKILITSVQDLNESGRMVARVTFVGTKANPRFTSGELDLLPDLCWAIQRCDAKVNFAAPQMAGSPSFQIKSRMIVEYSGERGGIPTIKRVRFTGTPGESTFDFDEVELGVTTPEREFTLESYGLPDPTAPPADPARGHATYWLLGSAVLALVAAYVVRKRWR